MVDKKTLLLVADERQPATAERKRLQQQGYRVISAASCDEAIIRVADNPRIDLVLMDIDPGSGLDGIEIARKILEVRDVPVVFLSSRTTLESVRRTVDVQDRTLRTYIDNAPVGIFVADLQGRYLETNRAAELITGYTRTELATMGVIDIVPPDQREVAVAHLNRAISTGSSEGAITLLRKDRERIYCVVQAVSVADDRVLGYVTDITEQIRTERALRYREEQFLDVVQNLTDLVVRYLPDTTVTFANDAYVRAFGPERHAVLGTRFIDRIPVESRDRMWAYLHSFTPDNPTHENENRTILPTGEARYFQWLDRAIFDVNGKVREYQGVGRDVTERHAAEQEVRRQLREKEILLREVHHRIKNNFATVESLLALEAEAATEAAAVPVLQNAAANVHGMRLLYDKLLEAERYEEVSAGDYITDLVESIVEALAVHTRIDLTLEIEPVQLPTHTVFPLGVILNELITNTLKYAFSNRPTGHITVQLATGTPTGTDHQAVLTIEDDGSGLPDTFDPGATNRFGLELVRMLIDQINGTWQLQSCPSGTRGARSTIRFPL